MIDTADILVSSGAGGDGAISFRREKYVPRGGPDGGDGGAGGSVFLEARPGDATLLFFHQRQKFSAHRGGPGQGRNKTGGSAEDVVLPVPVGTLVYREGFDGADRLLADLDQAGVKLRVARGGGGGVGNKRFATATNQVPRLAEVVESGEDVHLKLEVKLLADVGVVGVPNVGKSSLLTQVSAAHPKIAAYPFSTTEPVLAVVESRGSSFIMEEVPGLVEGAHLGVGLGHAFLRHAERTRLLLHMLDGTNPAISQEYDQLSRELREYSDELAHRPRLIAVNKVDVPDVRQRADDIRNELKGVADGVLFVSAATGEGVDGLMTKLLEKLQGIPLPAASRHKPGEIIEPPPVARRKVEVLRTGSNAFEVHWPRAERLAARVNPSDWLATIQLMQALRRMGVARALESLGAGPGDTVRIGGSEFDWVG